MHTLISKLVAGVIALFVFTGAQAATVSIDFEDRTVGEVAGFGVAGPWTGQPPLEVNGFNFFTQGADPFQGCCAEGGILIGDNTTKVLGIQWAGTSLDGFQPITQVRFERVDGTDFALNSMDIFADSSGSFSFTGTGFLDGVAVADLSTAFGSGGWLNVDFVVLEIVGNEVFFEGFTLEIDNINASVVPIPPAIWLFGSALAGLYLRRRRN